MRKRKKNADQKTEITFTGDATVFLTRLQAETKLQHKKLLLKNILFISVSTVSAMLGSLAVSVFVFYDQPIIPSSYTYLVITILSSLAGISIIFLVTRWVYQQRRRERDKLIEEVRLKESDLFSTLHLDFERIINSESKELNVG